MVLTSFLYKISHVSTSNIETERGQNGANINFPPYFYYSFLLTIWIGYARESHLTMCLVTVKKAKKGLELEIAPSPNPWM